MQGSAASHPFVIFSIKYEKMKDLKEEFGEEDIVATLSFVCVIKEK